MFLNCMLVRSALSDFILGLLNVSDQFEHLPGHFKTKYTYLYFISIKHYNSNIYIKCLSLF